MEHLFDKLDKVLIPIYNQFLGQSPFVDLAIWQFTSNLLFKGGVLMPVLWGFWFLKQDPERVRWVRTRILATYMGVVLALGAARILIHKFPYRDRPIKRPEIFTLPANADPALGSVEMGNSFPSDHAALFMCLATGIFLVSRRWGLAAYVYVALFICFPRMYVGYHHPTDIIGGTILGVAGTALACLFAERTAAGKALMAWMLRWSEERPATFYAGFFLVSFEIVELFDSIRHLTPLLRRGGG